MCVNILNTVKHLAGFLQCNGRKLNDIDGFSDFYSIYCVRIDVDQPVRKLWNNNISIIWLVKPGWKLTI